MSEYRMALSGVVVMFVAALVGMVYVASAMSAAPQGVWTPAWETVAAQAEEPKKNAVWLSTPCEYEDSVDCFWDATKSGNGVGESFYAVKMKKRVCVMYWRQAYAKRNDRCWKE